MNRTIKCWTQITKNVFKFRLKKAKTKNIFCKNKRQSLLVSTKKKRIKTKALFLCQNFNVNHKIIFRFISIKYKSNLQVLYLRYEF